MTTVFEDLKEKKYIYNILGAKREEEEEDAT